MKKTKQQILDENWSFTDPYNAAHKIMGIYAQSIAKEVVEELRGDTQVYTEGEAAIKSYAINLLKSKFNI